jgi:phosphoribosylformylglycinamidine cyclo-ligase
MNGPTRLDHVDYDVLDRAKNAFIAASRQTLAFAKEYGFVPGDKLGASANVFELDLKPFLAAGAESLAVTLLPEGLGTADDARPEDLTGEEARRFWHNIAYKTVATMTNDAASGGLQPILLSLYLPSSTPETVFTPEFLEGFLEGIVAACQEVGCVYFSGETPQLKNKFHPGVLDVAGATFGLRPAGLPSIAVDRLGPGNRIVLLGSSGPHENGFTGFRALAAELSDGYRTKLASGEEYWAALNRASVLYAPLIQDILRAGLRPTNLEPITGHGWQKLMRTDRPLRYVIDQMLPVPEIFQFIEQQTVSSPEEMISKYNYGAGFAIFTQSAGDADHIVRLAEARGIAAVIAGRVEESTVREVVVEPLGVTLAGETFQLAK